MISGCSVRRGFRFPFIFFCLAAAVPLMRAQIAAWPLDGPAFSASPAAIQEAAEKIPAEKFADVTVLYEEEDFTLDAAGRLTNTHRMIYRIETEAGVQGWSEASVEWEAFYQNVPEIEARVIQPNGTVTELDQKTVTDVAAQNQGDGTYSDDRLHEAPLPALSPGVIVEVATICADKEPYFTAGGAYRNYFQRMVPVIRSRMAVEVPAGTPLEYKSAWLPDLVTKDETTDGVRRVTFDQGHLDGWVNEDISLPTDHPRVPWVEFSTGQSWAAISAEYEQLAAPQIQTDAVKSLLPANPPQDRNTLIAMLVASLHQNVRYTGVEFGKARLQPQTSPQILERHYGDCKDKASLLVAMLRAAGIPADMALLDAGPGLDVVPDLPGINLFDHAIVYVPAGDGGGPLWIDATAEYTKVGDLPYPDQGREALIIAKDTTGLTLTPQAVPADSVLLETRKFVLADYGPAHAIETSQTSGYIDANYRGYYGDTSSRNAQMSLENYAKQAYAAKALSSVQHGDAADLTKPFLLTLDMAKAERGDTDINDASVVVYFGGIWNSLPDWFGTNPDQGTQNLTPDEQSRRQKAEANRSADYEIPPFIAERRYQIVPPVGFTVRGLPPDETTQMGPATLTRAYSVDAQGIVTADFRFDTGKDRYSVADALALRKAIATANKEGAIVITFDQAGAKLLAQEKIREALATDQSLIASHPQDAVQHVRMAYVLLHAGIGEQARTEATEATQLDPKSAAAWKTLGWVLQHNLIGVLHGKGFDLAGAADAYRKAAALDPDDTDTMADLAELYEYDANGTQYGSVDNLNLAIQEYQLLKAKDQSAGEQYEDRLLFCLLYAHRYKELLADLTTLPSSPARDGLAIAATTATEGAAAGLQRANQVSGGNDQRDSALRSAGEELAWLRMYPEAAQILSACIAGQSDAPALARQVEIYRNLHPYDAQATGNLDPQGVVRQMMVDGLSGSVSEAELSRVLAHHAYATDAEWQKNTKDNEESASSMSAVADRLGLLPQELADLTLGTMKLSCSGNDAHGYRVTMQQPGVRPRSFFVTKEDGVYRVVADQTDTMEVGNEALYLLHQANEVQARSLLDWKRDSVQRGGGDDPLSGPLFARLWTSGESKGATAIKLAAASLLLYRADISPMLPELERSAAAATGPDKPDAASVHLLMAEGWLYARKPERARPAIDALLKEYPDSTTVIGLAGEADRQTRTWTAWNALVNSRLAKHPDDHDLLLEKVEAEQADGDFDAAGKTLQTVLNGMQANAADYNNYAWNALFEKQVNDSALQAAQQATTLTNNQDFASLHTLACVYAARGKTTEARQTLLEAMAAADLAEPNSEMWYAFGTIYEQFGATQAAIAAFRKVEKPTGPVNPVDTWILAQQHLKTLGAEQGANARSGRAPGTDAGRAAIPRDVPGTKA
jgi:tetratricopeptide (TPR) repeat protein/transglutaminase-like putative cysteine protease